MGRAELAVGNSIKCHEKRMLGKPFCVAPRTCTSYCPPDLRPKHRKYIHKYYKLYDIYL